MLRRLLERVKPEADRVVWMEISSVTEGWVRSWAGERERQRDSDSQAFPLQWAGELLQEPGQGHGAGLGALKLGQVEEPLQGEREHCGWQGGGRGGELCLLRVASLFPMPPREQGHIAVSEGLVEEDVRVG